MDAPEEIPLEEAVARGLIPCATCGAKGAGVKRVGGKPHFLCPKCAGGSSKPWIGVAAGAALLAAAAWWLTPGSPVAPARGQDWVAEADALLRQGKFVEARASLEARAKELPGDPRPHVLLGHCLLNLGYVEGALSSFRKAVEIDAEAAPIGGVWIGVALQRLGWSAEALPLLQAPFPDPGVDARRKEALADCLIDLERYDEALQLMGPDPRRFWERHRALRYGGKEAEAESLAAALAPKEAWSLRATRLREEGDFDGARRVIEARRTSAPEDRLKLARAELSIAAETGDVPRLEALAVELAADPRHRAEGLWFRAMGRLLAGDAAGARAAAEDFLAKTDPELSSIRLERLQMRRLAGKASDGDVEAEAKRISRVRSNDLYWFLAVATGDRAWAAKGLAATPGRNFPYHALKKLSAP